MKIHDEFGDLNVKPFEEIIEKLHNEIAALKAQNTTQAIEIYEYRSKVEILLHENQNLKEKLNDSEICLSSFRYNAHLVDWNLCTWN